MRIFVRKLLSTTNNFSYARISVIRHASSDKKKSKQDEVVKQEDLIKNIVVEKLGGVTTINIDRSSSRNSLNIATLRELAGALDAFEKDPDSRALVLHGEGGSFCSGFDMDEIQDKGYNNLKDAANRLLRRPLCYKPTIAAMSGYAVAEGFELALACDLRIAEDTAIMGCLGRRFGVPQSLFGARRLSTLIGLSQALDLLITGRLINGKEAMEKGLLVKVTSTGTALGEAVKLGKSIGKFPQNALLMDKLAAINAHLEDTIEDKMRNEAVFQSVAGNAMNDVDEGVRKFQKGIGKHGKFYRLTEVELKDWELEEGEDVLEVYEDPKQKKT